MKCHFFKTQTNNLQQDASGEVDMQKLSEWLKKIYPKVSKELKMMANTQIFNRYNHVNDNEQPVMKFIQEIQVHNEDKNVITPLRRLTQY